MVRDGLFGGTGEGADVACNATPKTGNKKDSVEVGIKEVLRCGDQFPTGRQGTKEGSDTMINTRRGRDCLQSVLAPKGSTEIYPFRYQV